MREGEGLPGDNDRRLCVLKEHYDELVAAVNAEASDESTDGAAARRQDAIVEEMLGIPADSVIGIAAKLAVARIPEDEPTTPFEKLEHRALKEIERLGGFGPETGEA
jgi:hypothetical protein